MRIIILIISVFSFFFFFFYFYDLLLLLLGFCGSMQSIGYCNSIVSKCLFLVSTNYSSCHPGSIDNSTSGSTFTDFKGKKHFHYHSSFPLTLISSGPLSSMSFFPHLFVGLFLFLCFSSKSYSFILYTFMILWNMEQNRG